MDMKDDFPAQCTECNEQIPKTDRWWMVIIDKEGTTRAVCQRCLKTMTGYTKHHFVVR
jgi:hypothetical protein